MRLADARIFGSRIGDVALIGSTDVPGLFITMPAEVQLSAGTAVKLDISFQCQMERVIAELERDDEVEVNGETYRFLRRVPDRGREDGSVHLELGTFL